MSGSIRTSNLFSAEDYQKVYAAYSFIDYTAYDFDSLKQAMLNYIQTYYPENFSDYTESSEFIAIIELIAYFGTSLAFRTDLNSRENFIDTATRRESIIRLASMVNYVPSRNIAANGLFKISSLQTDQSLIDSNGNNLNGLTVFWNDPNNSDWFDQFVQITNASFSQLNPFGRPSKSGLIGSIPTDLYQMNSVTNLNVVFPATITINSQVYPIDICNPDFTPNQTIFERDPDPANAFNFIYRNDSLGVSSSNTGFFLYFRQGNLINTDTNFSFPTPNTLFPIPIQNINNDDVYVQQTNQAGNVINQWKAVPALAGENIIYNSIQFAQRNIFDVLTDANDAITVRFADGNFGNVPTGLFRFWTRVSANQALVIRPTDAQGLQISIPYIGADQQTYTLRVTFDLQQTISNAAPSETNAQIKLRAPEVFSTQSRMVNGADYNVLPLVYGNQIIKLQAIDRTMSGQSRYIDVNDPTGFHKDLIIFGQDGGLYRDNQNVLVEIIQDSSNAGNIQQILVNAIEGMLLNPKVNNFFYDEYLPKFESTIRVNTNVTYPNGFSILDLSNPTQAPLFWETSPATFKNTTGYFANSKNSTAAVGLKNTFTQNNLSNGTYQPWGMIETGAVLQFGDTTTATTLANTINSAKVNSVIQAGIPIVVNPLNPYANIGPVELGVAEQLNYQAVRLYPVFRNILTAAEIINIVAAINNGVSFFLYYDLLQNEWNTSTAATPGYLDQSAQPWNYAPPIVNGNNTEIYSDWSLYAPGGLLYVNIAANNQTNLTTYDLTARGRVFVFDSYKDVRFYWEPNQVVIDNNSGLALQDTIEIMPFVNTNSSVDNNIPVITDPRTSFLPTEVSFTVSGVYVQDDGYLDNSKVQVSLIDSNSDGIPDNPDAFNELVSPTDRIVFEYYTDALTGYLSTRPWIANWQYKLASITTPLYVYFPMLNPGVDTVLFNSPFIADRLLTGSEILNPASVVGINYAYMNVTDLLFINNLSQLLYTDPTVTMPAPTITIANQLSAFFNNNTDGIAPIYPWLIGTQSLVNKASILNEYFLAQSYLLSAISPPGFGVYYKLSFEATSNTAYNTENVIKQLLDTSHFDKNGKVFTQNEQIPTTQQLPVYFKWSHYSPIDQRIDPSPTNIIDMIVITNTYYIDMVNWSNANGTLATIPTPPTTEELRVQFQNLDQYKMVSDSMIWNSGVFKILFGPQADPALQAIFKVVKSSATGTSDNEVKTLVITAINQYFDIRNWDFGENFFYTELAAFIHQQLSGIISSVVIVPNNANTAFGNLFEIMSNPNEIFMSSATVNNVQIITSLSTQNLNN